MEGSVQVGKWQETGSDTRISQTKPALRCYECEGVGYFAREFPTRLNRECYPSKPPGKRHYSEHHRRSRLSDGKPHTEQTRSQKGNESGKRERSVIEGSSFHLNAHDNAVEKSSVSMLLEYGTPLSQLK